MKLLDLYSGAGGAARGYQMAGFYVVGVDHKPQPRYAGDEFVQADALEYLAELIRTGEVEEYDLIHASPPCQAYVDFMPTQAGRTYPTLIEPTRELLIASGQPYVIENVEGAPLINPLVLCGSMFGLSLIRHRLFECSPAVWFPPAPCACDHLYTASHRGYSSFANGATAITVAGANFKVEDGREAMGIGWMVQKELAQAIPPMFTEWLGRQMVRQLAKEVTAA